MALVPAENVPAPQPGGLRYGLFTVANGPLPLPGHGSGGGVQYQPVTCGRAHRLPIDCESPGELVYDDHPGTIVAEPFQVYGSLVCGALGYTQAELQAVADQNLTSGEQGQVEAELATHLATADAVGSDLLIAGAVSKLEEWIYSTQEYGHPVTLHASPGVAALAAAGDQIVQDGPRKRTPLGSLWSFGLYPPGSIWVTGQVTVWRNDIWSPNPDAMLNRVTNQYHVHGSREYAVAYDCYAGAVTIGEA